MIRTTIRFQNDMVVVFDEKGEQLPKYQGRYEDVKDSILEDAPLGALFAHWRDYEIDIKSVSRKEW